MCYDVACPGLPPAHALRAVLLPAAAAAGKFRSGGPEALHQLHQEINKLYLDHQVGIS